MKQHRLTYTKRVTSRHNLKIIFQLPKSISSPHTSSNLHEYLVLPLRKNKNPPETNVLPKVAKHTYAFRKADMHEQKY